MSQTRSVEHNYEALAAVETALREFFGNNTSPCTELFCLKNFLHKYIDYSSGCARIIREIEKSGFRIVKVSP